MGALARLVDEVGPLLQAELPHRAEVQHRQPQGVHVQLEGIEALVLGLPDEPQKLGGAILDGGQIDCDSLGSGEIKLDGVLKIAEEVLMIPDQYILRFDVSVRDPLLLQEFEGVEHPADEAVDLLDCEELQLLPAQADVLQQVHLILLHEDEDRLVLLALLSLLALLQTQPGGLLPPQLGLEDTGAKDGHESRDAGLQLADFLEDCDGLLFEGHLLDDAVDSALEVQEVAHEVLASLDELPVLELLQRVEAEGAELLADAFVHLL